MHLILVLFWVSVNIGLILLSGGHFHRQAIALIDIFTLLFIVIAIFMQLKKDPEIKLPVYLGSISIATSIIAHIIRKSNIFDLAQLRVTGSILGYMVIIAILTILLNGNKN